MTELLSSQGMQFISIVVVGIVGFFVLWGLRTLVGLIPMSRNRRDFITRVTPVIATFAVVLFLLYASTALMDDHPAYVPAGAVAIVVAFVFAAWSAIRDFVSGVVLKAGRVCQVGDHVRIGEVHGRVERMGLRVMALETTGGDEAIIPYAQVARSSVLRTPVLDSIALHVFKVSLPPGMEMLPTKILIREAALRCHWSVLSREPQITFVDDVFEVTVFALQADRGPDIEHRIRRAVEQAAQAHRTLPQPVPSRPHEGSGRTGKAQLGLK